MRARFPGGGFGKHKRGCFGGRVAVGCIRSGRSLERGLQLVHVTAASACGISRSTDPTCRRPSAFTTQLSRPSLFQLPLLLLQPGEAGLLITHVSGGGFGYQRTTFRGRRRRGCCVIVYHVLLAVIEITVVVDVSRLNQGWRTWTASSRCVGD